MRLLLKGNALMASSEEIRMDNEEWSEIRGVGRGIEEKM